VVLVYSLVSPTISESIPLRPIDLATFAALSVGVRYRTAALGLKDAALFATGSSGRLRPGERDVFSRLAVLFRAVRAIESVYSPTAGAASLRSSNPRLDDQAPLVVLAIQPSAKPNRRYSRRNGPSSKGDPPASRVAAWLPHS
jgi:hypothetical protein